MPFRYATVRFETDAERLAQALPPGLSVGERPEVYLDVLVIDFLDAYNVFFADPYHECAIWLRCRRDGADRDGYFLLEMPLDGDWGRVTGREILALSKKDGVIHLDHDPAADRVSAGLRRRGRHVFQVDATVTDDPAPPATWLRELRDGGYGLRHRLHPDWRRGPVRGDSELVRNTASAVEDAPETATPEREGPARALTDISVTFPDPTPDDPIVEFPVRSIIAGAWFANEGLEYSFGSGRSRRDDEREVLHTYTAEEVAPWALWSHDRPRVGGESLDPDDWPRGRSATTLDADELAA